MKNSEDIDRRGIPGSPNEDSGTPLETLLRTAFVIVIGGVLFWVVFDKNSKIYELSTPVYFTAFFLGFLSIVFCIFLYSLTVYLEQFIHPLTESESRDSLQREITLCMPFDKAFEFCRDSLSLLPRLSWKFHDKTAGTMEAWIWHQATIKISLIRINDGGTKVIVKGIYYINPLFPEHDIFSFPFLRRRRTIRQLDALRNFLITTSNQIIIH